MNILNQSVQRIARHGFIVAISTFIFVITLAAVTAYQFANHSRWVQHTHAAIELVTQIDGLVDRAETSQRGYLFHHDSKAAEIYHATTASLKQLGQQLVDLVADNPIQHERAITYFTAIESRIQKMDLVLLHSEKKALNSVIQEMDFESNQKLREMARILKAEEANLLEIRQQKSRKTLMLSAFLILFSTLLALSFIILSRRNMQKSLLRNREQAQFLNLIFDSMGDGLMVVDVNGHVTNFNRAAENLIGADLTNVTKEYRIRTSSVINPATGQLLKLEESPLTRALAGESLDNFETIVNRGQLGDRMLSTNARPILNAQKKITGGLALFRDVTDIKKLEIELAKASAAAVEGSRLKSEFLASMSHEIRTPMNGVLGMATILLDTALTDDQSSYVKIIKSSADSLLGLINQILDHSKIESGKLELASEDFNLHECVHSVTSMFHYLSHSKNITLEMKLHPDLPEFMRGDSPRLRQILINLVGNALKFTEQGFVRINVAPAPGQTSKHQVMFEVKDTGPGIPIEVQSRLFERFSQVHDEASAKTKGSGLGLTISRELVKLMNGTIGVESAAGFGSRFWFTAEFGLAEKVVHQPLSQVHSRKTFSGHVLVAEDQTVNQTVIRKFLSMFGLTCEIVTNGQLATEAYKKTNFDLVLMDCQMPVMDGYTATATIRQIEKHAGKHTPIVALTAEGNKNERKRCLDAGMNEFLSKPIEIERLQNILSLYLKKNSEAGAYNIKALEKLMTFESDGRPLALVLIDDFLSSSGTLVREMQKAAKTKDFDAISNHAHALRGTSLTLGLESLGHLCESLEDDPRSISQLVPLNEQWTDACEWLNEFMASKLAKVS